MELHNFEDLKCIEDKWKLSKVLGLQAPYYKVREVVNRFIYDEKIYGMSTRRKEVDLDMLIRKHVLHQPMKEIACLHGIRKSSSNNRIWQFIRYVKKLYNS